MMITTIIAEEWTALMISIGIILTIMAITRIGMAGTIHGLTHGLIHGMDITDTMVIMAITDLGHGDIRIMWLLQAEDRHTE